MSLKVMRWMPADPGEKSTRNPALSGCSDPMDVREVPAAVPLGRRA